MLGTLICDDCAQILEAFNLIQFFTVDSDVHADTMPFALLVISLVFPALICQRLQRSYQCHQKNDEALYPNYFFESYYILHNYSIQLVRFIVFVTFGPRKLLNFEAHYFTADWFS